MKSILKSKLTYLILLVIVNVAVIISLCLSVNKKFEFPTDYAKPSTGEKYDTILSKYYSAKKGTLISKEEYDSSIEALDTMYSEYMLDTTEMKALSEVKKDDVVGVKDGASISAVRDGFCLSVEETLTGYKVIVYNYNQFVIKVSLSSNQYLKNPFIVDQEYNLSFGTTDAKVKFSGYDLSEFKNSSIVYAVFVMESCDFLVTESTYCYVYSVKDTYENAIYIDASAFDYTTGTVSFFVYDGTKASVVSVTAIKIIDSYAVINGSEISEGTKLYVK